MFIMSPGNQNFCQATHVWESDDNRKHNWSAFDRACMCVCVCSTHSM